MAVLRDIHNYGAEIKCHVFFNVAVDNTTRRKCSVVVYYEFKVDNLPLSQQFITKFNDYKVMTLKGILTRVTT